MPDKVHKSRRRSLIHILTIGQCRRFKMH